MPTQKSATKAGHPYVVTAQSWVERPRHGNLAQSPDSRVADGPMGRVADGPTGRDA